MVCSCCWYDERASIGTPPTETFHDILYKRSLSLIAVFHARLREDHRAPRRRSHGGYFQTTGPRWSKGGFDEGHICRRLRCATQVLGPAVSSTRLTGIIQIRMLRILFRSQLLCRTRPFLRRMAVAKFTHSTPTNCVPILDAQKNPHTNVQGSGPQSTHVICFEETSTVIFGLEEADPTRSRIVLAELSKSLPGGIRCCLKGAPTSLRRLCRFFVPSSRRQAVGSPHVLKRAFKARMYRAEYCLR